MNFPYPCVICVLNVPLPTHSLKISTSRNPTGMKSTCLNTQRHTFIGRTLITLSMPPTKPLPLSKVHENLKKRRKKKKKLCSISRQLVTPVDPSPDTPAGQTRPACRHSTSNRVERPHSKHMAPVPCPSRPFFLMEKEMGNPSQSTTPSRKGKKKGIGESHQRTDVTHSINFQPHASNPTPFLFPSHQLQPTTIPFRTHQPSQAVS